MISKQARNNKNVYYTVTVSEYPAVNVHYIHVF